MKPVRVGETGRLAQTEGSSSAKEKCMRRDSSRLGKRKVYYRK